MSTRTLPADFPLTTRLRSFRLPVLAHENGRPKTFANRTQAVRAIAEIEAAYPHLTAWIPARPMHPRYVVVEVRPEVLS